MPWFRVQQVNLRLALRLHPGRGFASAFALWLRWGRFASWRESGRTRADLSVLQWIFCPSQHSVFCGRAQYEPKRRADRYSERPALCVGDRGGPAGPVTGAEAAASDPKVSGGRKSAAGDHSRL